MKDKLGISKTHSRKSDNAIANNDRRRKYKQVHKITNKNTQNLAAGIRQMKYNTTH